MQDAFADNLWLEYEHSLSKPFRSNEGIYYTPKKIIVDMLKNINDIEHKTFLDPCCGCGNFIIHAIEKGFDVKHIFGFDTDIHAVEITKKRIFEQTGIVTENIIHGDFLEAAKKINRTYNYIFTNPPWGKKLSKKNRDALSIQYQTGKSKDTCSFFFFACLQLLQDEGCLGFLLPESFFNISTFEDARRAALCFHIERLIDYGKCFKGLLTKAQAIILKNKTANKKTEIECEAEHQKHTRRQWSFNRIPKHIFNFWADEQTNDVIEHVYSQPHTTLANNAVWGMGIVTGNNNEFCKAKYETGFVPIFRGQDITAAGLKEPSLFIAEDISNCQQTAPIDFYKAKEKLIYRFISGGLVFYYDTKQQYFLNSANMLILDESFPLSGQQLCDLFNSDFMNYVFRTIFRTHKILRSDLELLPIHSKYFFQHKTFNEDAYLHFLHIGKQEHGKYVLK